MKNNPLQPISFVDRPLWPTTKPPPHFSLQDAEFVERFLDSDDAISRLTGVSTPTISFFPAVSVGKKASPAVIVCPGGGYEILAWNHEGLQIVSWLNACGVSAFLLKYRCPDRRDAALADAARAVRVVRSEAAQLNVMPDKIGILGFSAGAHLAARLSTLPAGEEAYERLDQIDMHSSLPDFQLIIYPAYISREGWAVDPDFSVTATTPPAFITQAEDDVAFVDSSLAYFIALKAAGVKAELHIFPRGGHGYGMLRNGNPTQAWPDLARTWMEGEIFKEQ